MAGTLLDLFDADISGRDFPRGKPDPTIFLTAAAELGRPPAGRLLCGRGRRHRYPRRQGRRDGRARRGPARRRGVAGQRGGGPGRDDPGRRVAGRAGRGPAAGTAGGDRAAAAIRGPAAERLVAHLRRLRAEAAGATRGPVRAGQRLLRHPRRPARGPGGQGELSRHLCGGPVPPAANRHRRSHRRERRPGPGGGCRTIRICSATSTSRSRTTSGSTSW